MPEILWESKYDIGLYAIDRQHQCFVEIINRIAGHGSKDSSPAIRDGLLVEIYKYADYHFSSEELFMLEQGYPDLDRHRLLHQELLTDLRQRIERVRTGSMGLSDLVRFLFVWFVEHTADEDRRIAAWITNPQET